MSGDEQRKGHSSYSVRLIYVFRAIEKILPALKGKSKYGWVAPGLLCFVVLATAVGMGIYTDGYGIHHPLEYQGHCPSPAVIRNSNCELITVNTVTVGSQISTQKVTEQAGTIENLTRTVTVTK